MISRTLLFLLPLICYIGGGANGAPTREPSIQVYGLPKRFFKDNGYIERVYIGELPEESATGSKIRADARPGNPLNVRRKFVPEDDSEEGIIELVHLDSKNSDEDPKLIPRNRRTIESQGTSSNLEEDMQTEESKVFRPLFVYRQQVAKRKRIQRERNSPRYYFDKQNSFHYYPQSG